MMTRAVGTLTPGTLLYQGRYRIDLLLATTPHRAIYRAWNLARGRASTIIELAPATDQLATRALERAAPLVQLDHPALTGFQVVFVEQETVFIGMAFAGGQLLDRIMDERSAPIPPAAAVRWISQAAEMLEFFAGSLPTWHLGDLSPTALFVTVEDRTQILGFEAPLGLLTPAEIAAGLPPGSVAPELHDGQADGRSDVYALAASLYLLLTRQHWGGGDPATETALAVVAPALPRPLIDAVRRGLARDPAARWQDAAALNGALLGAMAAPDDATNGNWWESMPAEPEADTQEMRRVDLTAAAAAGAAAATDAHTSADTDPAYADPNTTLDRVPAHIFTDAADNLDMTTKQRAVTLPPPETNATSPDATAAVTGAALGAAAVAPLAEESAASLTPPEAATVAANQPASVQWGDMTVASTPPAQESAPDAVNEPVAAAPAVAPAVLDSLGSASGELDPHGLEDMQPIDHAAVMPSDPMPAIAAPPTSTSVLESAATLPLPVPDASWASADATPAGAFAPDAAPFAFAEPPATVPDASASTTLAEQPIDTAYDAPSDQASVAASEHATDAPVAPEEPASTNWWSWAVAGTAGVAGASVAAAALHHDDTPTEVPPPAAVPEVVDSAPADSAAADSARSTPETSAPGTTSYVPSWATTPADAPVAEDPVASAYVPWGYSDTLATAPEPHADPNAGTPSSTTTEADTSATTEAVAPAPAPTPFRYAWQLDDEEPLGVAPASTATPVEPAPAEATASPVAEEDADQLGAWTRFADRVSPSTLAQASSAFAGWSAATPATEPAAPPVVAPPEPAPAPEAKVTDLPVPAAATPPTHPAPSPFVGQSISAHTDRSYEPNMPPPGAKSKTPSRPLGSNPFFNRIRDMLGATSEPSAALGTIVLPRHMYPQHSYSILVRLQTRTALELGGDRRMAIVEVEAPANAFYLPVRRLALPIPAEGGLSEGTLAITALRPSSGASDRIVFTFKQTDGVVLHKGAYVADVSILTAQQITNGEPMITLVHPLDIPA